MTRDRNKKVNCRMLMVSMAIALVLFDAIMVNILYDNFQDKVDILCMMLNNENAIDHAAEVLKTGEIMNTDNGKEILNAYGYKLYSMNALYDKFLIQSFLIVGGSILVYLILWGIIYILNRNIQKELQKEIRVIEDLIFCYKQGIVNKCDGTENQFVHMKNLYDEVCSLGDTLKLLHDREMMEKEATKSLVSDISHQLKTPVAALKTCFEILQQDLSPEERTEFTERCHNQLLGIENLLGALLNISRMEAGMIEIKLENQCIFNTLVDSINRVYEKAEEKNIQIELEAVEETKEISIPHDKKWFCEGIINILENAIKYSSSNKKITIHMLEMAMFFRLEISDEGFGIPKEDYNLIFRRFYRGKSSVVKNEQGSGIGLYLTREIISKHHGTIRVESDNKGSRFIIQLPYK